jgi:hypothetical protein
VVKRRLVQDFPLRVAVSLVTTALCGCDLSDTVVPVGEPVVVVHGVIRPDLPEEFRNRQFIVIERSLIGLLNPAAGTVTDSIGAHVYIPPEKSEDGRFHRADSLTIPYGGYPSVPIEGAGVWVANLDFPDDTCGGSVQFVENPGSPVKDGATGPGIYWGPQHCPTLRAGDRLALTVETSEGEVVTGLTAVPSMSASYLRVPGDSISFGTDQVATFNRDLDTLRIGIEAEAGRLLQFEVRRLGDLTDFGTKIYVDTTAFGLPADVVNTFVIGDEDDVFRAGRDYIASVALTDQNYFDFSRSRNNSFTGRGFINRLKGGIGIFGSLVASSTTLRAIGQVDDPREGPYTLRGTYFDDVTVDLQWDLYLALPRDTTEFSAFVEGPWFFRDIRRSIDGNFAGNEFTGVIIDTVSGVIRADTLRGVRQEGVPWQVIVFSQCGPGVDSSPCGDERTIIFRGTMEQRQDD